MSGYAFFWSIFQDAGGPARTIARFTTAYNTLKPQTYIVCWEPDHREGPRLAAYTFENPDKLGWGYLSDELWLVGWFNKQRGENSSAVLALILKSAVSWKE